MSLYRSPSVEDLLLILGPHILIFAFEITWTNWTKLVRNDHCQEWIHTCTNKINPPYDEVSRRPKRGNLSSSLTSHCRLSKVLKNRNICSLPGQRPSELLVSLSVSPPVIINFFTFKSYGELLKFPLLGDLLVHILIFAFEIAWTNWTKLVRNDHCQEWIHTCTNKINPPYDEVSRSIICTKLQNICSCSFRVKNLTRGSNEPVSLT
jgi:L-rhamnose mutarotase